MAGEVSNPLLLSTSQSSTVAASSADGAQGAGGNGGSPSTASDDGRTVTKTRQRAGKRIAFDIFPSDGSREKLARISFYEGTSPEALHRHIKTVLGQSIYNDDDDFSTEWLLETRTGDCHCALDIIEASKSWPQAFSEYTMTTAPTTAAVTTMVTKASPTTEERPELSRSTLKIVRQLSVDDPENATRILKGMRQLELGRTRDSLERAYLCNIRFLTHLMNTICSIWINFSDGGSIYSNKKYTTTWARGLLALWIVGTLGTYIVACCLYYFSLQRLDRFQDVDYFEAPVVSKKKLPGDDSHDIRPMMLAWDALKARPYTGAAVSVCAIAAIVASMLGSSMVRSGSFIDL